MKMQIQTTMYNNMTSFNKYSNKYTHSNLYGEMQIARCAWSLLPFECVETRVRSSNAKMSLTIEIASLDDGKFLSMWLPIKR